MAAFAVWKTLEDKQRSAAADRERAKAEEDFLRSAVSELEDLAPEAGEADKLAERRTNLQHREKITDALHSTEQALSGERGAAQALTQAGKGRLTHRRQSRRIAGFARYHRPRH